MMTEVTDEKEVSAPKLSTSLADEYVYELEDFTVTSSSAGNFGEFGLGRDGPWSSDDSIKNDPNVSVGSDGIGVGAPLGGMSLGKAGSVTVNTDVSTNLTGATASLSAVYAPVDQVGPFRSATITSTFNAKVSGDTQSGTKVEVELDAPDALVGDDKSLNVGVDDKGGVSFSISKAF